MEEVGDVVMMIFAVAMAWVFSYGLTGVSGSSKAAAKSYAACVCAVVAFAWASSQLAGGHSWRRQSEVGHIAFYVCIVPALFGVYCGRRWPMY